MAEARHLDDRKASILRAIVAHYVRSGEPVGSKTLVERFGLGVSAATVRNEMSALEDAGFIYQPHTSAGRVPTDIGYRYYVDSFVTDTTLPERDARLVRTFFTQPRYELEDALRQTASLLSNLTDTAAVVFAPALQRSFVLHVQLVRLASNRVMMLLVTDTGRVENHVFRVPESLDDVYIEQTVDMMNRVVSGVPLDNAAAILKASIDRFPLELREAVVSVARAIEDELSERENDRVFLEGTSNIVDEQKFADLDTVRQVIGALEHRRLVLELLADALSGSAVSVRIGAENPLEQMQNCAVVTAAYGTDHAIGSLGVVGPTRMNYSRTIAAVHEVASALGRMLSELGI